MKPNLITTLCSIAMKPGASSSTRLITTRRLCRIFAQRIDSIHAECHAMRRKAAKLKAFAPFTRQAVADLEQQAREHRQSERSGARRVLAGFGKTLMFDREGLAKALGFDRMCDLLGVNPVHRHKAHLDGDTSLRGVAYISRLEDSATDHGDDWGAGGPIFHACHAAMMEFIRETPSHLLPDPFGPGAPFGPKLPPQLKVIH